MSIDFNESEEDRRQDFLDAAVEYLHERDIARPITDTELKRVSAEVGYTRFEHALDLFQVGITNSPLKNMRFSVQMSFAAAEPTSAANPLHPPPRWTREQILDQSVRLCRSERLTGPLSHNQVHMFFTILALPSAHTIARKFDDGNGWGFYSYQQQLVNRMKLEGLPVKEFPTPPGFPSRRNRRPLTREDRQWSIDSTLFATYAFMVETSTRLCPTRTQIDIAARQKKMPASSVIDTLFAKHNKTDGMEHFRAYVNSVIGPAIERGFAPDTRNPKFVLTASSAPESLGLDRGLA